MFYVVVPRAVTPNCARLAQNVGGFGNCFFLFYVLALFSYLLRFRLLKHAVKSLHGGPDCSCLLQ